MLPVVYQSGYLTIKDFEKSSRLYTLDFPNREIEEGFLNVVLNKVVSVPDDDMGLTIDNLYRAIINADIDKALSIIKAMFRTTGLNVVSELQSVAGRSDITITTKDSVFIFELKMDKGRDFETVAAEALTQIDQAGYTERFALSEKKLYKVGVVFSSDGKGMIGWKVN